MPALQPPDSLFRVFPARRPEWPALAAVVLAHAAFLAFLLFRTAPLPAPVTPPMVGFLVSEASSLAGQVTSEPAEKAMAAPEKKTLAPSGKTAKPFLADTAPVPPMPPDAAGGAEGATDGATGSPAKADDAGEAGSGGFFAPRVDAAHLGNPRPKYPAASRRMGEEGTVTLSVHILADGSVADIRLKRSSGFARLDEAALSAVRHWRYVPARRGNTPVDYWYAQPVTFSLTE